MAQVRCEDRDASSQGNCSACCDSCCTTTVLSPSLGRLAEGTRRTALSRQSAARNSAPEVRLGVV